MASAWYPAGLQLPSFPDQNLSNFAECHFVKGCSFSLLHTWKLLSLAWKGMIVFTAWTSTVPLVCHFTQEIVSLCLAQTQWEKSETFLALHLTNFPPCNVKYMIQSKQTWPSSSTYCSMWIVQTSHLMRRRNCALLICHLCHCTCKYFFFLLQ